MSLDAFMTQPLITLTLDDDLSVAKGIFEKNAIHHLLLVDENGVLSGVITDRDLYKYLSPTIGTNKETHRDTALLSKKLHQIVNKQLITSNINKSLIEAVLLFHDNNISCLPIVDDDNRPIGIITWRDIIKFLAKQYRQKQAHS